MTARGRRRHRRIHGAGTGARRGGRPARRHLLAWLILTTCWAGAGTALPAPRRRPGGAHAEAPPLLRTIDPTSSRMARGNGEQMPATQSCGALSNAEGVARRSRPRPRTACADGHSGHCPGHGNDDDDRTAAARADVEMGGGCCGDPDHRWRCMDATRAVHHAPAVPTTTAPVPVISLAVLPFAVLLAIRPSTRWVPSSAKC